MKGRLLVPYNTIDAMVLVIQKKKRRVRHRAHDVSQELPLERY